MKKYLLVNAQVINEGKIRPLDVLLEGTRISKIANQISDPSAEVIDVKGNYIMPGMIDDQVHFRDPGLTHKGNLTSESRAAVAGGVTSFMDMPNTIPNTLTRELLEQKYQAAALKSHANFSFFMGVTSSNMEEALRVDNERICGITDDGLYFDQEEILANNPAYLEKLFSRVETLVALHSEDDAIIRRNYQTYLKKRNGVILARDHADIRSSEACVEATKRVLGIQQKYQNRLHFFHISTAAEANLFPIDLKFSTKRVTAEACTHHLWFTDSDYECVGNEIKWNPSIKTEHDRKALVSALAEGRIDIIASDHAPHRLDEKMGTYEAVKSGAPIIQHTLPVLWELVARGEISIEQMVSNTSHRVADIYRMPDRGYIREGYFADLVEVDVHHPWHVSRASLHYHCGWSPLLGQKFQSKVKRTFVNGNLVFQDDQFISEAKGERLLFEKIR
jgi:dihydroorotase